MTVMLDLSPELENRLQQESERRGLDISTLICTMIEKGLSERATPPEYPGSNTAALFAQWRKEAEAMTPEQIAEEDARTEEFERNMKEYSGLRLHIPDLSDHD